MGAGVSHKSWVSRVAGPGRAVVAVAVVAALFGGVTPAAGAGEWDTRDVTATAGVQDSYPYKTADPSGTDPLGFPYRSSASYVAAYLADSGVPLQAEMPGADGPGAVRFAQWPGYNTGPDSWVTSTWRLGFHVKDDTAARVGDVFVGPDGDWMGVVYATGDGWVTVAGYGIRGDDFAVEKVRVQAGDCACVLDYLNTPLDASQGGVGGEDETVYDQIRRTWAGEAEEVSPPAVSERPMTGRVSLDGQAFELEGIPSGAWSMSGVADPPVTFPEGGAFDTRVMYPVEGAAHGLRYVLHNRRFPTDVSGMPGEGEGWPTPTDLTMSSNLDRMAWVTSKAMTASDECPDGSQLYQMRYDGKILHTSSILDPTLAQVWTLKVLGAIGAYVEPDPLPTGPYATSGLCKAGGHLVHTQDLYVSDLRTATTRIATPPQLNSDSRAGQESHVNSVARVSDNGVAEVWADVRASYGYPDESPHGYLPPVPLRERALQAVNLAMGALPGEVTTWVVEGNPIAYAMDHYPSLVESLHEISVKWTGAGWSGIAASVYGRGVCEMVEWISYACSGPAPFEGLQNDGPMRKVVGTYEVADPAHSWNEVAETYDGTSGSSDDPRPVLIAPATGDVYRGEEAPGWYLPWFTPGADITPTGRWWYATSEGAMGDTWGPGVCLKAPNGPGLRCDAMYASSTGETDPAGPNDHGEYVTLVRGEGDASDGRYAALWRPGGTALEMETSVLLPEVDDGGGEPWRAVGLLGLSAKTPEGRRTLVSYARGGVTLDGPRRYAIVEIPDVAEITVPHPEVTGGNGATRGQGVVSGGGRWEVGTRVRNEHGGELVGSRQGLVGVAVKRDTADSAPTGAAFYEFSSPSRRWRVVGRKWDDLRVDTAPQGYRLERPGSTGLLSGPCDVYSVANTGGKQPFLVEPDVDRRGTHCTWRFTEGSPSGHGGGDAEFALTVTRANGGPVVLDVPRTGVPLGPSNQLLVDAAGYDKPLAAVGRRLERAAKNLAAGLVDDLADDVADIQVQHEVDQMLTTLDPWVDHQLQQLKDTAVAWIDKLPAWLEDHVFDPLKEMANNFTNRWSLNFDWVQDGVEDLLAAPLASLDQFCEEVGAAGAGFAAALEQAVDAMNLDEYGIDPAAGLAALTAKVAEMCSTLKDRAHAHIENALGAYVMAPLQSLKVLIVSTALQIRQWLRAKIDEAAAAVYGALADLRALVIGFDLGSLKDLPPDLGTCPGPQDPGYDPNCRIDLVRDWARQALKAARDWMLDLVYEPDPNYDYHNPTNCGPGNRRLLTMIHCSVGQARDAWMEGFAEQLQPIDDAISNLAVGISAVTKNDEYDELFHCAAALVVPLVPPLNGGMDWAESVVSQTGLAGVLGATLGVVLSKGWVAWAAGALLPWALHHVEGEPDLRPNILECLSPTPGGWWPDDADWLPLGPWEPEEVERFLYAGLDLVTNALADRLSRISVDSGDVNAVGRAVIQLLFNLGKKTVLLDGEEIPGAYFDALNKAIEEGGDVNWEQVWGFLTDGVDGFTGAGLSDWESIQVGMRCAEGTYSPEWTYSRLPLAVKAAFASLEAFLDGCARGGYADGTLKLFLEDTSGFLGRPLVERFTYLWDNPKGFGERIHALFDTWEKRLVAVAAELLPEGLRQLAGWIRTEGTNHEGYIEETLRTQIDGLLDLLVGEAEGMPGVEQAVNAEAERVIATLERLANEIESQGAAPWLHEVAELLAWANARLREALVGVNTVVTVIRNWVGGLGLPGDWEAAIFALLDGISGAVDEAAQWVLEHGLEPMEALLDGIIQQAAASVASAVRAQEATVADLRDSLIAKFRDWLVEWAGDVSAGCREGRWTPGMRGGLCDMVTDPVDNVFDRGVDWIASAIEALADLMETRVGTAERTFRAFLDDVNCELVVYVYDLQTRTEDTCARVNAGLPPFEVKAPSGTLLNALSAKGEEIQRWILDSLAGASRTIRGFDMQSEELWAGMDATVQAGFQFGMFAVDPDVRAALGEYTRHAFSRVARYLEPMTDEQVLRAVGTDLGLTDLYQVIQDQIHSFVPFVMAEVYDILGNLPNVDGLAFGLRAATSLADVAATFGDFGDYLITWALGVLDKVTGDLLDLNARVAAAIGDSVLRVADNTLRVLLDGVVNVFRFLVWSHEYTFEKVMTPLIELGDAVPDMWQAPGFGVVRTQGAFAGGVNLEMRFVQDHGGTPLGGVIASYPSEIRPGEWYVVASRSFGVGSFTQPALTLEELDGNDGSLDVTGLCNVYSATGPDLGAASALEASGNCRWELDGRGHTLSMSGPLPEWGGAARALEGGSETVRLVRPLDLLSPIEAMLMSQKVLAGETAAIGLPGEERFAPEVVSVTASGRTGNTASEEAGGVSADGRYVVFSSRAANLVAGDANGECDVFVRDRVAFVTAAVSTTPAGDTGAGCSYMPAMSRDGRFVAFSSWAPDLVDGDANPERDVFVRDLVSGDLERVSVPAGGGDADAWSFEPAISGDGRYVAFVSPASNLVPGDTNDASDAFVVDRTAGTIERVSVDTGGGQLPGGIAMGAPVPGFPWGPSIGISDDGNRVVFSVDAGIYVRDRGAATTTRADVDDAGDPADNTSARPAISGDGRYVVFASAAGNLAGSAEDPDTNAHLDVFRRDLETGQTRIVSRPAASGTQSDGDSGNSTPAAAVSGDGRWVFFESTAANLASGVAAGGRQMYARDMDSGYVRLLSGTVAGGPGNAGSDGARVGADNTVVFASSAGNLADGDANGATDVFVSGALAPALPASDLGSLIRWAQGAVGSYLTDLEDRRGARATEQWVEDNLGFRGRFAPELATVRPDGAAAEYGGDEIGGVSPDGRFVVFASWADDLVSGDANSVKDVFVRDRFTGTTAAVSTGPSGSTVPGGSSLPATSANGNTVAFASWASALVPGDTNGQVDVFVRDLVSGSMERVSVPGGGGEGNGASREPALSADGRHVAFVSQASNLVAGDTNGTYDAFVADRVTGTVERVSVDAGGGELVAGVSSGYFPVAGYARGPGVGISDDGDRVSFVSGDAVYVRDRALGTTMRADVADDGSSADSASARATMSGDGRYVVFASAASNLAGAGEVPDANGQTDVFRRDLERGRTQIVSRGVGDVESNGASGRSTPAAAVSRDGRWVLFESTATNIAETPGNGQPQILARDMRTGRVKMLSIDAAGAAGNRTSSGTRVGAGATAAFVTRAGLDSRDGNWSNDVYASDALMSFEAWIQTRLSWWLVDQEADLADLDARRAREGTRQSLVGALVDAAYEALAHYLGEGAGDRGAGPARVNVTPWGALDNGGTGAQSFRASTSADGRYVTFASGAADLVVGDTNDSTDIFRRDTATGTTARVSVNGSSHKEAENWSMYPAASADGRFVAYLTTATNLTASGASGVTDSGVLVWDATAGVNTFVPGSEGATGEVALSADGRYVVYGRDGSFMASGSALRLYRYDRQSGTTTDVNVPVTGDTPDAWAFSPDVSDDGRYVVFVSAATNLHAGGDADTLPDVLLRDVDAGTTLSAGVQSDDDGRAVLGGDGGAVVFDTGEALVASDTNGRSDVYRYDVASATTDVLSVTPAGAPGNGDSSRPAVSDDGQVVVFTSTATDLAPATGSATGVFARDMAAGANRLVSVATDGRPLAGSPQTGWNTPTVSGDGSAAVFPWRDASNHRVLHIGPTHPPAPPLAPAPDATSIITALDGFVTAWVAGHTPEEEAAIGEDAQGLLDRLVALIRPGAAGGGDDPILLSAAAGVPGDGDSYGVEGSRYGDYAVFSSRATGLVAGDTNAKADVFVSEVDSGALDRVSIASDGSEADADSAGGAVSEDGSLAVFSSAAGNLVAGDTNGQGDVFVRHRGSATTTRVSVASDGTQADGPSYDPKVSADGRFVAFVSDATNLVPGDTNGAADVFVHDRDTATTARVSVATDATQGNGASGSTSGHLAISGEGGYVVFTSAATNLVPGDTNGARDVFLRDLDGAVTSRVNVAGDGTQGNFGVPASAGQVVSTSEYGWIVGFVSADTNLVPGDTNGVADVFYRDTDEGTTARASVASDGVQATGASSSVTVDPDGWQVGFVASGIPDPLDTNGVADAYVHDIWDTQATWRVGIGPGGAEPGDAPSRSAGLVYWGERAVVESTSPNLVSPALAAGTPRQVYAVSSPPRVVEVFDDVAQVMQAAWGVVEQWAADARADTLADSAFAHSLLEAVRDLLARSESADGVDWAQRQVVGERVARDLIGELLAVWSGGSDPLVTLVQEQIARLQDRLGQSPPGLEAAYYAGQTPLGAPVAEGVDPGVDFAWGAGGPAGLANDFSASWRGRVVSPVTGSVEFTVIADDGARLWIDGRRVIDGWTAAGGGGSPTASVDLVAGVPVPLRLEYREDAGAAAVSLRWRLPGEATAVVVPASALLAGEPRLGDLPKTITGLGRYGSSAAVVMGRAEVAGPGGGGDPGISFTALLAATEPYDDPHGSLAYGYRDGNDQVTVATLSLDAVAAGAGAITVTGSCRRLRVPQGWGPGSPPSQEGPFPCTWRIYDDAGTTRLDVSGAAAGVVVGPDWRLTVKYPS